jgi:ABC-type transport system substrate-binding protein
VGAGPYKLQTLQVGAKVVLVKNDAYWNASAYKLQTLEFDQVTLGPSAVTAMQSGALDLIKADPISSQPLASDAQFKVVAGASNAYIQLEFRQNRPPFNNIKARQAVAFAIDRDAINKITQNGLGEVASQSYPKASPVYDPALASVYKYDPAKAKSLLAEAFPNGADISIAYPGGGIVYMQQQVEIVQQELTAVGFRVKLIPLAGSQIAQTYYIDGQGEMFSAAEPAGDFPPSVLDGSFAPGAFVAKYDGAERADIGALTKQAIAAPTYDQMIALTKQAEKIVVNEALEVPVAFQPQVIAFSTKKIGGTPTPPRGICDAVGLKGVYVKKS